MPNFAVNFNQINQQMNNIIYGDNDANNKKGKVLHTVGLELESLGLSRDFQLPAIMSKLPSGLRNNFKIYRDGSSEIKCFFAQDKSKVDSKTGNRPIVYFNFHTEEAKNIFSRRCSSDVFGYELVSQPLSIEEMELTISLLLPLLEAAGDFTSERCATHIHVGMENKFETIKKLLRLGLWADELFYALSGMGEGNFRGHSNNAIYARPLINGPYFRYGSYYYQTLNWKKALTTKDSFDFFSTYALDINRESIKYHPARYFSINLYSILLHKTIEFRHFNQSFDAKLITSIAKLCQLFAEIGIKAKESQLMELEPGNPFELKSKRYYMDKLYNILYLGRMSGCEYTLNTSDIYKLESVIDTYKGIGIADVAVLTHVRDLNYDEDVIQRGGLIKTKTKPTPDGHTDIHNIKISSILGREVK